MGVASPGPFPWWMDGVLFLLDRPWAMLLGILWALGACAGVWGAL